jgi:uncharacterized cupredoxin-like copper-binding protein
MLFRRWIVGALALAAAGPALAHDPGHSMGGGKPGEAGKETRVIEVVATDNVFSLKSLEVKDGETVRFVVRNDGNDPHEFLIGIASEHAEHRQMMKAMLEQHKAGGHAHAMPAMEAHESGVSVLPGKTESFVWTFARTPNLEFACDLPGHYEDGMRGLISFSR